MTKKTNCASKASIEDFRDHVAQSLGPASGVLINLLDVLAIGPRPASVVTNQKLPFWALHRLAVQVHGSMNRAIQPFATEEDGDVLYSVTTDEIENASLSPLDLGVIASELAWDAILSSVPSVPDAPAP